MVHFVSAVSELELKKLELLQIAVHLLLIIEVIKQPGYNKPSLNRACVDNRNANSKGKCYCPAHGQSRQYEYLGSLSLCLINTDFQIFSASNNQLKLPFFVSKCLDLLRGLRPLLVVKIAHSTQNLAIDHLQSK